MKNVTTFTLAAAMAVLTAGAASAHHSFVAEFDPNKPKVIQGTVTKVEWTNPHARFYVNVPDAAGKGAPWEVELGSPNTLLRYGWKKSTLKAGDKITVDGYLARDGKPLINAKTVKLPDGRNIVAGSSYKTGSTPGL